MLGRILVTLGGLLVVALFAALLAPVFVDWTNFRQNFEDRASQLLGKKVVVNGAVSARILPFPSVTMEDVTVGKDIDGTPLVRVARFSLDAELAPFLSGEARIFDMRIEEPKARIRLLADGTLDWLRGSQPRLPARIVVLDERGSQLTTVALARQLKSWQLEGDDVALVIGGPDGLEPEFKAKAQMRIRLSDMTLPHAFARVLLIEQLYRAWSINANHPYHRE